MLWIALHLPTLSLEAFAATLAAQRQAAGGELPIALLDSHRIASANEAAQAQGVKPGLKRATALALAPQIVFGQADARRDAQALQPVAHAALAFTPGVSLQPASVADASPDTVLLEVQASLRYFGGLDRLLQAIGQAVAPLGHAVRLACAATAQGAALLARVEPPPCCPDVAATRQALEGVPVWLLGPGREHWEALQGMGLHTLGDLLKLPRSGVARRFGEAMLAEIDAALGRRPDPRDPIVLAPTFASRLELFARADTTEQVLHGAAVLLDRLMAWLSGQHAFVRRFCIEMRHETRRFRSASPAGNTPSETRLEIALAEPSRDRAHLLMLLREHLARLQLPAPTLELALAAEDITRQAPPNVELFATAQGENEGLLRLIERLQARLGIDQVQRLVAREDHRPERAFEIRTADAADLRTRPDAGRRMPRKRRGPEAAATDPSVVVSAASVAPAPRPGSIVVPAGSVAPAPRPVWLQAPQPLAERAMRPVFEGRPVQLLSGPERIEAGWWDSALAGRDYFIAETAGGALLWIYRERLSLDRQGEDAAGGSGWFLHGRFG